MKGLNAVFVSGNVGTIEFSTTRERMDDVCTFTVASEKVRSRPTWVRVNVYGGAVESCRTHLRKGRYVVVQGELMNRQAGANLVTEIRCIDVKFLSDGGLSDGQGKEGQEQGQSCG